MLLEVANKVAETVAENPFAAGGAVFGLVEAVKRTKPEWIEGKEAQASLLLPVAAAAALKLAGVAAFVAMPWAPLLINAFVGGVLAKPLHDSLACVKEQKAKAAQAKEGAK